MDGVGRALGAPTTLAVRKRGPDGNPVPALGGDGKQLVDEDGRPAWEKTTYVLPPLTLDDFGFIEQHMLAQRVAPEAALGTLLAGLSPQYHETLLRIAYKEVRKGKTGISPVEMAEWVDTREGLVFTMWVCLRKEYPGEFKTLEQTQAFFKRMSEEEVADFQARRNLAGGTDRLGNSTGRTPPTSPAGTTPRTSPDASRSPGGS